MTKVFSVMLVALALGGLAASPAAMAQAPTCDDIEFNANVTDQFPNAADGCLEVLERDGKLYAKFVAEVVTARRNGNVTLDIKTRDGSSIRQSFQPASDFRVSLDGRSHRVGDLVRGQEIRIYLPSDRWAVAQVEELSVPVVVAPLAPPPPEPEPEMVAELPGTASPLPLMGLGGVLLVLLSGGLGAIRRRQARK